MKKIFFLLLALILIYPGFSVMAQNFARVTEMVYTGEVYDGNQYYATFYPESVEKIFMIADVDNILEARQTQVYFWSLTSEYKADWSALNQPVSGKLEILQENKLVASLDSTQYALLTEKEQVQPAGLITGSNASTTYQKYQEQNKEYYETKLPKYDQELQAYQNAAADNLQRAMNKLPLVEIKPPTKPSHPLPEVSSPNNGFIIRLKPGHYQIQMTDNQGNIIARSQKKLEVFTPLQKGVGYEILPESQWTNPVNSDQPDSVIYWGSDSVLFVKPFEVIEYNRYQYTHLKTPQSPDENLDSRAWIRGNPIIDGQIEIESNADTLQRLSQKEYMVNQLPGSGLGYTIDEITGPLPIDDPSISISTFRAIKLDLNSYPTIRSLRLISSPSGVIPQSERRINRFHPISNLLTFTIPLTTLFIGAAIIYTRRRMTSNPKK